MAPREHLHVLFHDAKHALRGMRGNAGLSLAAILTLTLGIGANATIFSVVNAVALRPLPFRDGDRLVRVYATRDGGPPFLSPSDPTVYRTIVEQSPFFESIVAQRYTNLSLGTDEGPERVAGMAVTAGWLDVLGIELHLGRGFSPEEEALGRAAEVVLVSHGFWTRRLGADPHAVGRDTLRIEGRPVTVVGVLPKGFRYPYENDLWIPMNLERDGDGYWGLNIQARLRGDIDLTQARTGLSVIADRLDQENRDLLRGLDLTAIPTREVLLGDDRGFVFALFGAVGFVLLLISINLGHLLLARAIVRQPEMALRSALGASRSRQLRLVLTESAILAGVGGALGLLLTSWTAGFTAALVPGRMSNLVDGVTIDANVVGFTLSVTILTGLLFGAAPAFRASGRSLTDILHPGRSGTGRHSSLPQGTLVVGEIALALVILAGAGMLTTHYQKLSRADLGYDASKIVLASVPLEEGVYEDDGSRRVQFVRNALDRLQSVPGVSDAGAATLFPSIRGNHVVEVAIEGRPVEPEATVTLNHRLVTPEFFASLELPVLFGRNFSVADDAGAPPVAILSASAASRFFPGEDALGKRVRNLRQAADESGADPWVTIIGVVPDVREFYDIDETWYLPYAQHADSSVARQVVFTVHATDTPENLYSTVRAAINRADPSLPVFDVESIRDLYWESLGEQRLGAVLSGLFAGFGLIMAALGIGGVMSYSVGRRVHELGLRVALGAGPRDILLQTLGRGATWTGLGVAGGLAGSILLMKILSALVPEIGALDLPIAAGVSALLVLVSLGACYLPARRAVRVDPLVALRSD